MYAPEQTVPAAPFEQWRVLTGVRRVTRSSVPRSWWLVLGGMLAMVFAVYVHSVAFEAKLLREEKTIKHLKDQNTNDRAHLAQVQNPSRIDYAATHQLAMREPQEVLYLQEPVTWKASKTQSFPEPKTVIHEGF